MTNIVTHRSNQYQTITAMIDNNHRLAQATKDKYKKTVEAALAAGVDLSDRDSLKAYASTLGNSQRSHLKAVVGALVKETQEAIKGNVAVDNLQETQVNLMRLDALAEAITVNASKGEKAHLWLTLTEVKALLATCDDQTLKCQRDRLMLGLLVGAGLRREELVNLTFDDLAHQGGPDGRLRMVLNVQGKGAKSRVVPISDRLAAALDAWHGPTGGQGLIARSVSQAGDIGESLSAVGVFKIVRAAGQAIDKTKLAPHDLRRTYAQIGLDAGVSVVQISKLLGHASIATTQRYLNLELDLGTTISDFVPF